MRSITFRKAVIVASLLLTLSKAVGGLESEPLYQGKPETYWVNLLTNDLHSQMFWNFWGALGTNAIPVLNKAIEQRDGPRAATIRTNAAFILINNAGQRQKIDVTPVLINALHSQDPKVRVIATAYPDTEKTTKTLHALVDCLQDEDADVRFGAANVLCDYLFANPIDPYRTDTNIENLAFSKINQALSNQNTNISNAATIALRKGSDDILKEKSRPSRNLDPALYQLFLQAKMKKAVITAYAKELAIYCSELHGISWNLKLHIVDDQNKVVQDAAVTVSYSVPPDPDEERDLSWKDINGISDADGTFLASHCDSSRSLNIKVTKPGYCSVPQITTHLIWQFSGR